MLRNVVRNFCTGAPLVPKKVNKAVLSEAVAGTVIVVGTGFSGFMGFRAGLTEESVGSRIFFCTTLGFGGAFAGSVLTVSPIVTLGPTAGSIVAIGLFAAILAAD